MAYRVTKRAAKVRRKWREELPEGEPIPTPAWKPGDEFRTIVIIDHGPSPTVRKVRTWRTRRVDTLLVSFDDAPPKRMGWTRLLELTRLALPRELSPRHYG